MSPPNDEVIDLYYSYQVDEWYQNHRDHISHDWTPQDVQEFFPIYYQSTSYRFPLDLLQTQIQPRYISDPNSCWFLFSPQKGGSYQTIAKQWTKPAKIELIRAAQRILSSEIGVSVAQFNDSCSSYDSTLREQYRNDVFARCSHNNRCIRPSHLKLFTTNPRLRILDLWDC
jgi:hypothetical protein